MMLMKSRHNNTKQYLTGHARRAFLLFALMVVVNGAWGQITYIGSGVIDDGHVSDYSTIRNLYSVDASFLVPDIKSSPSWSSYTGSQGTGEHWDGTTLSTYFDCWNADHLNESHKKSITLNLPQGRYTILTAARGKTGSTITMMVNDLPSISMNGRDNSGKGITTSGKASFDDGTFANSGSGYGWQYFYITFNVGTDGDEVQFTIKGQSTGEGWISASTPYLLTTAGNENFTDAYTFELYNTDLYLNLADGGVTISNTPQELYMLKTSGTSYITDKVHFIGTQDDTNLITTSDRKGVDVASLAWYDQQYAGCYTLSCVTNCFIGVDNTTNGSPCYANKGQGNGDKNVWRILKTASVTETDLTKAMFMQWNGTDGSATNCAYEFGVASETPYGDGGVVSTRYADLSDYQSLTLEMSENTPRVFFNSISDTERITIDSNSEYVTVEGNKWTINIAKIVADNGYAHLNAIKGPSYGQTVTISSAKLLKPTLKNDMYHTWNNSGNNATVTVETPSAFENLIGQEVADQGTIYGDGSVNYLNYTDLSVYDKLVVKFEGNIPRFLFNRLIDGGQTPDNLIEIRSNDSPYATVTGNEMTIDLKKLRNEKGFAHLNVIKAWGGATKITSINLYETSGFLGNAKSTAITKFGSEQIGLNDTSASFDLSGADLTGVKYARFYIIDSDGNSLTDQSGLSVTYNGMPAVAAGNSPTNGVYVYDSGSNLNLNNISVTLTGTTGTLDQYKIVSLLSTSEGIPAAGPLAKEPNWDLTYTYTFIYPFAGNLKSGYFSHSKEVLLTTSDIAAGRVQIPFNEALDRIKSEYVRTNVATSGSQALASNLHIRWFVAYNGEIIANSEDYLDPITTGTDHHQKTGYGYYWNSATSPNGNPLSGSSNDGSADTKNWLNMNFTKPESGVWHDYKVVIWLSDDTSTSNGQTTDGGLLTHEPNINMVYYYSFFEEESFRFVHSKGAAVEAYPSLQYLIKESSVQQYDWDNSTSSIVPSTIGDTRQNVHTVTYDIYLKPNTGSYALKLPYLDYFGSGDVLEPAAYIRWYDWETDLGSDKLSIADPEKSWLEIFYDFDTGNSRGFIALNRDLTAQSPTHEKVGVTYNTSGLSATHVVACDVSKYFDGVYRGSNPDTRPGFSGLYHPYMLHEPTLSLRYLFRIHPASEIVSQITTANSTFKTNLNNGGAYYATLTSAQKKTMFALFEDNGRVAVSIRDADSKFSLRANLASLDEYYVGNASSPTQCNKIWWTAYYQGSDGKLYEKQLLSLSESSERIHVFKVENMYGDYTLVGGGGTKSVTATAGKKFHVVGRIGTSTSDFEPVVHYELEFIDAPAILVDDLPALGSNVQHRRKAYLDSHYNFGGRVYFDDFFQTSSLTSQNENHTEKPLPWADAQYGFCYPQIDQYRISTGNTSALTPIHGDYILLKSMCGTYSKHWDTNQPYKYFFWRPANQGVSDEELYDFTHLYGGNDTKYGSFLYVDAADEARTIASLDFDANLCSGSQIFYTAAVADVTNGSNDPTVPPPAGQKIRTNPQLMIRVYGVKANGTRTDSPIVSFLTGSLRTVAREPLDKGPDGRDDYKFMKWYQVYGHTTIPSSVNTSEFSSYSVDIDNYCENTTGADYCVDEIRFYTSTGKVTVDMSGGTCADGNMTLSAKMDVEHLEAKMVLTGTSSNPQHIYYRIYEKKGGSAGNIQYELYSNNSIYNNEGKSYGDVTICKYVLNNDGTLAAGSENNGYEITDGVLYFDLLHNARMNLTQGNEYFIALTADLNEPDPEDETHGWANPNNACDVYSNFFVPKQTFISFLDSQSQTASTTIISNCENYAANEINYTVKVTVPDDNEQSGFIDISNVKYDFFVGTSEDIMTGGEYAGLFAALRAYRDYETSNNLDYKTYLAAEFAGYEISYYNVMKKAIDDHKLFLVASSSFNNGGEPILETTNFMAFPVKEDYTVNSTTYYLCDYFPFTFTVDGYPGIPDLTLGFDDVDYSSVGNERVLRVGLEQLNKMTESDPTKRYLLHIPINGYQDKKGKKSKKLYFPTGSYLTISDTNDPTNSSGIGTKKFAKIVHFDGTDARPYVDKEHMYLALDLSECEIDFHEGYEYEVSTSYLDEDDDNVTNPCIGNLFILIKVVPEFVTWESQPVDNDGNTTSSSEYYSANWYNDDNWKRSVRSELYKDENVTGKKQNTATAGHPDGYDDNGEGSLGSLSGNSGFVPMKFTYVTLPSGNHAPSLINEPRVYGVGKGSRRQGGGFLDLSQTTLLTDRSPRDPEGTDPRTSSNPTENIYYDMLVRYSYSPTDKFGEGCFGHRYITTEQLNSTDPLTAAEATAFNNAVHPETNKVEGNILTHDEALAYNATTWADDDFDDTQGPQGKVFDCEKFQGNICREIYFKPGAELLRQQRLTYEKAWVEMELDANKWYLLASPLQSTYAGDMYVPTSMTNVADNSTVKGRQVTEAFQPINFDQSKGYSRTLYPIYQRSWGLNNGTVYVKDNDIRANSYSANLKFNTVSTSLVEWGHTFNDVQVPYHTSAQTLDNNLAGFSIRAHKKDQTDKTLIRLPKADTSYDYYNWDNTSSDPAATGVKNVSKDNYGYEVEGVTLFTVPYSYRLVTDEHSHDGDLEYSISAMQQNGDYVLVGNPYMVSIDMKKFFDTNSTLDQTGYWTYEASAAVAHTKPTTVCSDIIKPMQGFFVKKGTATEIIFNRDMQIDGNFPPSAPSTGNGARQTTVTLSAANSRGSSSASLEVSEKASAGYASGEDVETLFDSNLADVPMVYTVAADGQAVSINQLPALEVVPFGVTCSGDEMIDVTVDHSVYVFDALLGTTTAVKEGESVSIQPNDYGRYYLTVSEDASGLLTNKAVAGITISVRDRVVTITSNDDINQVKAVNVSGVTAYESTVGSKTTQFTLPTGTYIIDVNGVAGSKTVKILVK